MTKNEQLKHLITEQQIDGKAKGVYLPKHPKIGKQSKIDLQEKMSRITAQRNKVNL